MGNSFEVSDSAERVRLPAEPVPHSGVSRRRFLLSAAVSGVGLSAAGPLLTACSTTGHTPLAGSVRKPARGGTLRIAIGGGAPSDIIDPNVVPDGPSQLYAQAMFDQLTLVDESMQLGNRLAEELSHNSDATQWTIRVRDGVEFHNGKTLGAEDVMYTFQRILSPKTRATDGWLAFVIESVAKVDARTVRFTLNQPMAWFDLAIGDGGVTGIVPVGFTSSAPVGTGPFKFVSYTPGDQAVFERFANYWDTPAYLDRLSIQTINDDDARLNALLTGQADLVPSILSTQVPQVTSTSGLQLYRSSSSGCSPFTMRVDEAPFSDVRVRQAIRLCIDRQQLLEQAMSGYGTIGNDLYSPFDPDFDTSLVRSYDPDQAKSLLRSAGHSNLTVQLTVSQLFAGILQQAEVIAQNAAQIGIKINIQQVDAATLFGPNYLQWPFAMDIYPGLRYLTTSALADGPFASINETHFKLPEYETLWKQASATTNVATRKEILAQMQQILFDQGGFIIPAFPDAIGAVSSKVGGFPAKDLRGYGPVATDTNTLYISG